MSPRKKSVTITQQEAFQIMSHLGSAIVAYKEYLRSAQEEMSDDFESNGDTKQTVTAFWNDQISSAVRLREVLAKGGNNRK